MELTIDPAWVWEPRKGFLGLPREIRDIIYDMVLMEPPLWERRHRPLCKQCPRDTDTFEHPLFDFASDDRCDCSIRCNTGLLGVNRQIHAETAPLFWSKNVFCFDRPEDFTVSVGADLRPEYRDLLQHVSILGTTWEHNQESWDPDYRHRLPDGQDAEAKAQAVWETLFMCRGLKTLEMGLEEILCTRTHFPYDTTGYIALLREKLPQLDEFVLARIWMYDVNPKTSGNVYWWTVSPMRHRHLLYVKAQKPLDLSGITSAAEAKEAFRGFRTNFMVHVKFALETTLLGIDENDFSTGEPQEGGYKCPGGMDDRSKFHDLELRDGSSARVMLLGLPISQQTRISHVKERWREDARRKAAGKPTMWEEKFKKVVQVRQDEKKAQRAHMAVKERQVRVEARQQKQKEVEDEEQEQERKSKAKQRAKLARKERQAQETKKVERKRVPSP